MEGQNSPPTKVPEAVSKDALDNTILENALYMDLSTGRVIRLIELLPGTQSDPVVTRMSIHELEYSQDYEAISYVWGNPNHRKSITCNGSILSITASLDAALRRFRYKDRPRILWADAMCINQGNVRERSHHVAFMDRIYKHAKRTLVHMGKDTDGGAGNVADLIDEHVERMSQFGSIEEMPIIDPNDPIFEDFRWKFLVSFMRCDWFSRAWVLQEVGVAAESRVYYGRIDFSYHDLMQLCRWIMRCAPGLQTAAGINILTIHTDWEDWGPTWVAATTEDYTLLDLLSHATGLHCKDPRDHIYALLGHPLAQLEDGSGPVIKPDYTKAVENVYQEISEWMLVKLGLGVLSAIQHDDQTVQASLPSWFVRWDMDLVINSMGYYSKFCFRAGIRDPMTRPRIENDFLILQSIPLDTVVKTYQFPASESDWSTTKSILGLESKTEIRDVLDKIWTDIHLEETPCIYPSEDRLRAFSMSLCTGLTSYLCAEENIQQHESNFAAFWALHEQARRTIRSPTSSPEELRTVQNGNADTFCFDMSLGCQGRRFFITERGYYGLGPWITIPGDKCFIFPGAKVPFIVRKDTDQNTDRVVGEAYVHGIMHGEYLKYLDSSEELVELSLG